MIYRVITSDTSRNFLHFSVTWSPGANHGATFKTIKLNQCEIMSRFFCFGENFWGEHRVKRYFLGPNRTEMF